MNSSKIYRIESDIVMISSCIESDIVIVSSCRAARPDPHYSRCTVNRASHHPRIMDLVKLSVLRGFFHCGTFYSSPSMKIYQEWSTPWTVFTCSARGQIPCGCWDLRTWIVKLMKNCSFCDVLFTAEHFIQVVVQKYTMNCQLDEQCQHVWQGCRYHADVQSKGPESKIWWKTGRFVTFFTMPNIWFKS